jgi:hypothetical protein
LDFVSLGRESQVSAVLGRYAPKVKHEDLGRLQGQADKEAALTRFMDKVTDPKFVAEAEVYRPVLLVDCD